MQSGSVSLSQKFAKLGDGASVVASSNSADSLEWTQISVRNAEGLATVIRECADASGALICGEAGGGLFGASESTESGELSVTSESGAFTQPNVIGEIAVSIEPSVSGTSSASIKPTASSRQRRFVFADLKEMRQVIHHEPQDLVVSVQTGIKLNSLNNYLAQFGQWFPVSAPPETTLLEVLNHGDGGLLEHGFGSVRDLVLGLEIVTGGGVAIKSGGTVVKNVTGYDTTKLFVGSHGTLGVAHVAHLRLYARPEKNAGLLFHSPKSADLLQLANDLIGADLTLSCLELVDLTVAKNATTLRESTHKLTQRWNDYGLLVRVSGPDELLKEIVPQIRECKIETTTNTELSVDDTDDLMALYSEPRFPRMELSVSVSEMLRLLSEWIPTADVKTFQYRLATGRFHVFAKNGEHLESLHQSLRACLSKTPEPNTVALVPNRLEYKIDYSGADLKKFEQIKASLKEKFDPARCLNPLALL